MSATSFKLEEIPIKKLYISDLNVRKSSLNKNIEELAESINLIGLQQPIVVVKKDDRFEVIIGQRRYLASKLAGEEKIYSIIRTIKNDNEGIIASFSENIHRLDLTYRDKNRVAERLLAEFNSTEEISKIIGVTERTVRNYLGYSIVPDEIKDMVERRQIRASTAIRISRSFPDKDKAIAIAMQVHETPRREDKRKFISLAKENPDASIDELKTLFKKSKFRKVTIDFTPMIATALSNASDSYKTEIDEIITEALADWLSERGFL